MTVLRFLAWWAALGLLSLGSGCGRGHTTVAAETEESLYQEAKQLQRQGRNPEALTLFLKLIERRGEQPSPEAHLEAGEIYLRYIKDPLEAIHHFNKYLQLQPNSREAMRVRERVNTAKREFARTLPGRPTEDAAVRVEPEQMERLRRENEELRAELATLRGGGAAPIPRGGPRVMIPDADRSAARHGEEVPIIGASVRAPELEASIVQSAPVPPTTPSRTSARTPVVGGRTHTIVAGDTLYNVSKRYGVTMEAIVAANREVLPSVNAPLRLGSTLRIP